MPGKARSPARSFCSCTSDSARDLCRSVPKRPQSHHPDVDVGQVRMRLQKATLKCIQALLPKHRVQPPNQCPILSLHTDIVNLLYARFAHFEIAFKEFKV